MAGFSDHYLSDFVLHGTSDNNFHHKLLADLNLAIQVNKTVFDKVLNNWYFKKSYVGYNN